MNIFFVFLIIFIIIFFIIFKIKEWCNKIEINYYNFNTKDLNGPKLLLLAGTHGNEPAGSFTLFKLNRLLKKKKK